MQHIQGEPVFMPGVMQKWNGTEQRLSQFTSDEALNLLAFLCHAEQPLYCHLTLCGSLIAIPFGSARNSAA